MLIDKKVKVKITKKNIEYYSKFFNIKLKDIIEIDIEKYLQKNSNIKLNVKCDICGNERHIKYQAYTKNINSCKEYPIYTCDICSHIKIKSHNLKKYGVEYYSQTNEYNDKFKKTMLERYGVEYSTQSDKIREKIKQTNLKRYGVENIFENNEYIKQKFNDKYGVDHPSKVPDIYIKIENSNIKTTGYKSALSSPEIREKIKQTNLEKYGENTPTQSSTIYNKIKQTNLEKYGYITPLQNDNIKEISKKTLKEKYNSDNIMKSEIIRKNFLIGKDNNYIKYLENSVSIFKCDCGEDHEFEINIDNFHSRRKYNIPLCTICNPIGDSQSIKEKELFKFINSIYDGEVIKSYRDSLEIDVYLPELKIGFEFNGLYWHSEECKDKNYHLNKTNYFKEKGIRIIHIWEDDWDFKRSIIESQIKNWIGLTDNRIYARKCMVKEVKNSTIFLNNNHIQGKDGSKIKLGLYYEDELVSLMTFNKVEGRKVMSENEWNLSRFCNKIDTNVIGGASKLLKYFIKEYKPTRIVSYADKDWSNGILYYNLNFNLVYETKPDYKYIINNQRIHKSRYRKSKLNTELTESQHMKKSHILKIWDCGKMKFEFNLK